MPRQPTIPQARARHASEERTLIISTLERNAWNLGASARELGIVRSGLQAMIRSHGLRETVAEHNTGKAGRPRKAKA